MEFDTHIRASPYRGFSRGTAAHFGARNQRDIEAFARELGRQRPAKTFPGADDGTDILGHGGLLIVG